MVVRLGRSSEQLWLDPESNLSQESSEPASSQGVRVGVRVKGWFRTAAILNTWAQRRWFGKGLKGELFSLGFWARIFSATTLVLPWVFLFSFSRIIFDLISQPRVTWGSLNRNPDPHVIIPRFPIRIGFESHVTGRDKISSYPRASRSQCSGQIWFGLGTQTLEKPSEWRQSSISLGPGLWARLHKYWASPNH